MAYSHPSRRDDRPTLPPLHTLGLLSLDDAELPSANESNESNDSAADSMDSKRQHQHQHQRWLHARQASISSTTSSCTASSRGATPCDALPPTPFPNRDFTLVRTTFDQANAIIVIPEVPHVPRLPNPPRSPSLPSSSASGQTSRGSAFLLVGSAVEQFRQSHRPLANSTRFHPYRIVPKISRRSSTSPTSMAP